jgi:Purine catabolism regulatory protein-like family/PucR C-terminal helix-turn-helix domain
MLLRGLAQAPDLRLRVLVGEDALDRPVDGVFTTDLLDPRRYLTGGEIVLTGLMWRRGPDDSEAFVAAVAAAGAVALAAGDAALGSVPEDLVAACQRHGMPLFEVPVDVSFAAITEQVLAARPRPAGPGPAVARLRALAAGRGRAQHGSGEDPQAGLAEVFAVAGREYGTTGWVLSAAGRLVAGAPAAPGRSARSALAGAWLRADALPVTVLADGMPYSLFGVSGGPAHRLAGWFVAVAGDQGGWDTARRAIAAELAAAAAAHRARHEEARRAARRAAGAVIGRLADRPAGAAEPGDPETAAALQRSGLGPGTPLVAVALTAGPAQPGTVPSPGAPPPGALSPFESMQPPGAAWPSGGAQPPGAAWPSGGAQPPGAAWPSGGAQPPGAAWPPGAAAGPHGEIWPQVARVLLEEMLPGAAVGALGGTAVALAPGSQDVVARIRDVTRELAAVYGPGVPDDQEPGQFPGQRAAGYPGAPGDVAPGAVTGRFPGGLPGGSPGDAIPGGYSGDAGPLAAGPGLAPLCLAFGLSMLSGGSAPNGPQAGDGPAGLGGPGGMSGPEAGWTGAGLGRALDQARQAGRIAALLGGGVRVVDAAGLGSVELLLATAPDEARRAFRVSVLTPLLDYDADHGTELVRTLRVFLACSGSWTRAAEEMFVHVNSLRYRMRRVEELTGRDLGSLADQAALLLALRLAGPAVPARGSTPPPRGQAPGPHGPGPPVAYGPVPPSPGQGQA